MKRLALPLALVALLTGCGPAPAPDARIALARRAHHYVDSTQTVAVGILTKLGTDAERIEAEKSEVGALLQQSTATLEQLDQLNPADTKEGAGAAQLTALLAKEGALIRQTKAAQNRHVQEAQDLNSTKALMGAK
jgi:hypothetical protein